MNADRATISSQFLVIKGSLDSPIFARPPGAAEAEAFALGIVTNYLSYFSTHGMRWYKLSPEECDLTFTRLVDALRLAMPLAWRIADLQKAREIG